MNQRQRADIFTRLRAANPEPTTELRFRTPFELLVAVMLSAQATDVSVNQATGPLYAAAATPQAMLDLGVDRLRELIKSIGLFNTKAANVIKTCRMLVDEHGGEVPRRRAALEALPGVGRKTAKWCSTRRSASPRSPSTRTSSGSRTAPESPPAGRPGRWRTGCCAGCRGNSAAAPTTG